MKRTLVNLLKYRRFKLKPQVERTHPSKKFVHKSYTSCRHFSSWNFQLPRVPKWEIQFLRAQSSYEHNRIWTILNLLCCARISTSPLLCYNILNSEFNLAVGILFVAGFSDFADGLIARKFPRQASKIGTFLDPLADKVLVISLFSTLTYIGAISGALTFVIVLRDLLLLAAGCYIRYLSLTPPVGPNFFFDHNLLKMFHL